MGWEEERGDPCVSSAGPLGGRGSMKQTERGKFLEVWGRGEKECSKTLMSNVQYKVVFRSVYIFPHSIFPLNLGHIPTCLGE